MKAVVFHGVGDVRLDDVPEPRIEADTDAIVRITASAICGTDLHIVRGTLGEVRPGTVLGHEAVGVVEEVGAGVQRLTPGDRVVVPSTIACGTCRSCNEGWYAQCLRANPNGPLAGTAFFGGPKGSGPFAGLQAERARIPFANIGLVKLPLAISDDEAIVLSDILPTAYFAADLAAIRQGHSVAVFGCGPVGQLAIACATLMGAGRVIAVDANESRLEMARRQGAEVIDYERVDPVEAIRDLTHGLGAHRAIDAVGVDANRPHEGPAAEHLEKTKAELDREVGVVSRDARPRGDNWHPGDGPSMALAWAVESLASCGVLSIVGVYPATSRVFPIGTALNKNLSVVGGNCHHRKYIPLLVQLVEREELKPAAVLTQAEPLLSAIEAYLAFDTRRPGWIKVKLEPQRAAA